MKKINYTTAFRRYYKRLLLANEEYIDLFTKRATAKYAQRSKKGRATRKGMDEGRDGQTRSLQERQGENRKQSANPVRSSNIYKY